MVNIAVIGYGYWGPNLVRNWNQNKRSKLKYICDIKAERISKALLDCPNIEAVKDYTTILNDPQIDAINIATPIETHYEIAKKALENDKHILVEKPVTASSDQMEELINLAEKKRKIIMAGHTFLYSPPVIKINEYIKNNTIGAIDFIQLTRINLGRLKHDYNVIWDLAPHDFSILEYWLNMLPESIQVMGKASKYKNVCDVAFINLKFPKNILVNIHLNWLSPVKLRKSYIVGNKQMIVYDDTHPSEKVRLCDMGIDVIQEPATFGEFQLTYRTGDIHIPHLDNKEPLSVECEHFIDCITGNVQPKTNSQHALRIIKMIEAAQESLKNNGEVIMLD